MSEYKPPILTVAVLGFRKPIEADLCLRSLRAHLKVSDSQIVYLDNGSNEDYPWKLYQNGLCDVLISKRRGMGGGVGQTDLFRWSPSPYTLFVQEDQLLVRDITNQYFIEMMILLEPDDGTGPGYDCIDLNGDQSNRGVWTDRAHLIRTDFFNGLAPFPNGGPGPLHHLRWNENYLQEKVRPERIYHVKPAPFMDRGVWTIREVGGGIVRMQTDTKQVWWDRLPTESYVFPEMSEYEWTKSIEGTWIGGTVPEAYKAHSFNCWGNVM